MWECSCEEDPDRDSWTLIRYDGAMMRKYEKLKKQGGNGKKAIVEVARTLAIQVRRLILDRQEYALGVIGQIKSPWLP